MVKDGELRNVEAPVDVVEHGAPAEDAGPGVRTRFTDAALGVGADWVGHRGPPASVRYAFFGKVTATDRVVLLHVIRAGFAAVARCGLLQRRGL